MKVLREFESHLFRQFDRFPTICRNTTALLPKIVSKAILRGDFSFSGNVSL
jgi:hypothetical protein